MRIIFSNENLLDKFENVLIQLESKNSSTIIFIHSFTMALDKKYICKTIYSVVGSPAHIFKILCAIHENYMDMHDIKPQYYV